MCGAGGCPGQGEESLLLTGGNWPGTAGRSQGKGTRAGAEQSRLKAAAAGGAEPEAARARQRMAMPKGECAKPCQGQKAKVHTSKRQQKP